MKIKGLRTIYGELNLRPAAAAKLAGQSLFSSFENKPIIACVVALSRKSRHTNHHHFIFITTTTTSSIIVYHCTSATVAHLYLHTTKRQLQ